MDQNIPKPKKRPVNPEDGMELFDESFAVASSTECTGMIPTPATTDQEIESYGEIYDVPLSKDALEAQARLKGHGTKKKK